VSLLTANALDATIEIGSQRGGLRLRRIRPGHDDQIEFCGQLRVGVPGPLPNSPSGAIAQYGVSDPFAHRDTYARGARVAGAHKTDDVLTVRLSAIFIDRLEVSGPGQSPFRGKARVRRRRAQLAARRLRPRRRRFRKIARPAAVAMRCRNPCLRRRRVLDG